MKYRSCHFFCFSPSCFSFKCIFYSAFWGKERESVLPALWHCSQRFNASYTVTAALLRSLSTGSESSCLSAEISRGSRERKREKERINRSSRKVVVRDIIDKHCHFFFLFNRMLEYANIYIFISYVSHAKYDRLIPSVTFVIHLR